MYRRWSLAVAILMFAGCDIINLTLDEFLGRVRDETGSSKLVRFRSEQELVDYFRSEIDIRGDSFGRGSFFLEDVNFAVDLSAADDGAAGGEGPTSAAPTAGESDQSTSEFSETTTQEVGVDEADVVKTDGDYLYIIGGRKLRVVDVQVPGALSLATERQLEGTGVEMYLPEGRIVAISTDFGVTSIPTVPGPDLAVADIAIGFAPVGRPTTIVTVFDASQPTAPRMMSQTKFEGSLTSSRMIGDDLYLVLSNYQGLFYNILPVFSAPTLDVATIEMDDVKDLLPDFEQLDADGERTAGELVTFESLRRPVDPDGFGIVSIVSMNTDTGAFSTEGIVAEPGNVYSSLEALYLTDTDFGAFGTLRQTTDIYKFTYRDGRAVPTASGSVPGRILNQYSMGEFEDHLRVATTVSPEGFSGVPHNDVYVLRERGSDLVVVGSVEGIAPRETIRSARFIGDRGYVVTFEQIDPLFTLDLSDPTDPRIVGELKVPGFSTFIVPMGDDHLLTVGQFIPDNQDGFFRPWGVQLSVFDISDFANPRLQHNVVIGEEDGAYSEALFNPKAFTYFAERDLVALPVSIFEQSIFVDGDFGIDFPEDELVDPDRGEGSDGSFGGESTDGAAPMEPSETDDTVSNEPDGDTQLDDGVDSPVTIDDEDLPVTIDDLEPIDVEDEEPIFTEPSPFPPFEQGGFDGLYVFRVTAEDGFTELNRVSTRFEQQGFFGSSFTRGVFIGERVLATTDVGVRSDTVEASDAQPVELFLGSAFEVFEIEPRPTPDVQ